MPIRLRLLALLLVAFAAALLVPADAAAQDPPPCISCPPGGGTEVPEEPPAVDISPFDQSFTGDAAGKSQQVTIVFCSGWRIFPGTLKVLLNGVDVAARFSADTSTSTLDAGCTRRMTSVGTVTLGPGANTLFAAASNVHGEGEGTTTLSYRVASYGISVTPDQNEVVLPMGTTATHPFVLTNTGSSAATFNVTTVCGEAVSSCPASASQVTLAGGASQTVTVTYAPWFAGAFGALRLRATRAGVAGAYDEGSLMVSVPATAGVQGAPAPVAVDPLGGASPTPGLCLTMPAGPAAAYQCGDLRLAHALPTVRTLGRARTPMLVYNSAHAAPMALVGARLKLPSGAASPTLGRATLTLNTVGQIDTRDYAGGEFTPNRYRRFTLGKLSTGLATSLYDYTLSFSFFYGATQLQGTTTGTVGIVNRSASPFGAGWWLAGLEQIQPAPGVVVWTGGDGAQRRYVYHAPNTFVAPTVTHADTIRWTGYVYVRVLPGGDSVFFNTDGRHVATADRLGRRTTFGYDGLGRLIHIFVPTGRGLPRNRESHRFVYDGQGRLAEVRSHDAAGSWATPRRTLIAYALGDRRVTSITDPDGGTVSFTYDAAVPLRIASRTDRRGNPTTWAYDGAGKLAEASTSLGAGEVPARTRWQAAESRGWTTSSWHASTVVDGPRVDVPDVTTFGPGPFGAPADIVDADGRVTRTVHDAAFPALARQVTTPGGQKTVATYDARGSVRFVTDSSTSRVIGGVLRYATTEYRYEDARFPTFPTLIIPPEGDSTRIAYDAAGRREWMRDARGDSTRVSFTYDAATGQVATVRTAKAAALGHPAEAFFYDSLGNLERTQGALAGDVSHQRMDGLGRVVRSVSPLFAHTTLASDSAYVVNTYDVMDRVRTTESVGPAMTLPQNGVATPRLLTHPQTDRERLLVETFYDAEGQADSIARRAFPDSAQLGRMVTRWKYDAAGRAVREIAADGAVEHRAYDAAGNLTGTVTRRGHVLATSHDAMNRVVRQVTPAVGYPRVPFQVGSQGWVYPMYQPDGPGSFSDAANTTGLTIPADTAVFAYDSAGRMVRADNRDARITRVWSPNGTLANETQRIRTYRDTVFTAHVYTLTHSYDLNGRRTRTQHPASLAPAGGSAANTYRYHPHGALAAAGTMMNLAGGDSTSGGTGYSWDAEGKLVARSGFTQLSLFYDAGGRLVRRVEGAGVPMHDDTLVYDLRGKVVEVTARRENHVALHRYSGLGGLVYSLNRDLARNT
ncbi:MAG TPA: hypothetical protein VFR81_04005, partial [Longimicrobium sp.]|nr:hypothetical protein [Longimicrobium sp.]